MIALTVLALCMSGCTGSPDTTADTASAIAGPAADASTTHSDAASGPDQWRGTVPFLPLAVPAEMTATADHLEVGGLVSGVGDRPALVAAVGTAPDGRRYLRVSAWDGTVWQPTDVGPGVPGEPQNVAIAGNSTVTALAGRSWQAGTTWPFLLASTDRRSFRPVQLPDSLNGYRLIDVATDTGRIVALARNDAGDAAIVVVDGSGTGVPNVAPLPGVPDGQHRSVGAIALAGDTVVVTGVQGATDRSPRVVFRSTDAGVSWSEPAVVTSNWQAGLSGITSVPGGFLITGSDAIPGDPDANRQATAWFSADGVGWQSQTLPEPAGFRWTGNSSSLGPPTAAGGYVLAIGASSSSRSARLFQRQPTGEWIALSETDEVADGPGRGGYAVPVAEPSGSDAPGGSFVAIAGAHGMVVGQSLSGVWTTQITPQMYRDPPSFASILDAGDAGWRATIEQRRFGPFGDGGFHTWYEPTEIGLTGDTLTRNPWDPPEADDWEHVSHGFSDAAEVVLAERITENDAAREVGGWFRSAAGQPWQRVTGFGADPDESVSGVRHVGELWFAWGSHNGKLFGDHPQAMLWYSTDGITWARVAGDLADADRSSAISEFCSDPAGQPIAVGWLYLTDATPTATVWRERNGRWVRTILPGGPDARSWFSSCETVNGQLVIQGTLDDDPKRWGLDAADAFPPVDQPVVDAAVPARSDFGEPYELTAIRGVPGGYAATGRLDTRTYAGPVIWLSADGSRWSWVPLPTARPSPSLLVGASGQDLIVLSSDTNISQAWRIPDITSVIAGIPAPG